MLYELCGRSCGFVLHKSPNNFLDSSTSDLMPYQCIRRTGLDQFKTEQIYDDRKKFLLLEIHGSVGFQWEVDMKTVIPGGDCNIY